MQSLPVWNKVGAIQEVLYFTDGSFNPCTQRMAWAYVAVVRQHNRWLFGGYKSGIVELGNAMPNTRPCAHVAESFAIAYAMLAASCSGCPSSIVYDCVAAAHVAQESARSPNELDDAMTHIAFILRAIGCWPRWRHVTGHSGHPMNEFADVTAKSVLKSQVHARPPQQHDMLVAAVEGQVLPWLWVFVVSHASPSAWPCLRDDGTVWGEPFVASGSCRDEKVDLKSAPNREGGASSYGDVTVGAACFNVKLVTYNGLSLKPTGQVHCLDQHFHEIGVHLVGLQETRTQPDHPERGPHFLRFGSKAVKGQGGCQLWVDTAAHVGVDANQCAIKWDMNSFMIVHADPRILAVNASAGHTIFSFVVMHAPTSVTSREVIQEFWCKLQNVLQKLPNNAIKIIFADANAHFDPHNKVGTQHRASNFNAEQMLEVFRSAGIHVTSPWDCNGHLLKTWTSPGGHQSCIDYFGISSQYHEHLVAIETLKDVPDVHAGFDHEPLKGILAFQIVGAQATKPRRRFDVNSMKSPAGRAMLEQIFHEAPTVPWNLHASEHWSILETYLQEACAKAFPLPVNRPRKSFIDDEAWQVLRSQHAARHMLRNMRKAGAKFVLAHVFAAWKGGRWSHCASSRLQSTESITRCKKQQDHRAATVWNTLRKLKAEVRQHMQRCQAAYVRASFEEARTQGPKAIADLIRSLQRQGKKYRVPRVLPPLTNSRGELLSSRSEVCEVLGDHFAKAEKAVKLDLDTYRQQADACRPRSHEAWDGCTIPTAADYASALRRLKPGKAPGVSGLVPDIFTHASQPAAMTMYPLLLKMVLRQETPEAWVRSYISVLQKPGKDISLPTGWRSIALQEAPAKAACATIRSELVRAFEMFADHAQLGGRPQGPIGYPSHLVKGHLGRMAQLKRSAGIIFVDGQQAFYAVFRELATGVPGAQEDHNMLIKAIELMHEDEDVRSDLFKLLMGPSILEQAKVPPAVQAFLSTSLTNTFFQLDVDRTTVYRTQAGSMPGSPLADVIYQLAMVGFHRQLREQLKNDGLQVLVMDSCTSHSGASSVAGWVDDIALPIEAEKASGLVPRIATAMRHVDSCLRATGVNVNYAAGKTEAIACWRGSGSRHVRHAWLIEKDGWVDVALAHGRTARLKLNDRYVHLGSLVTATVALTDEIKHRKAIAMPTFNALRRRVLHNKFLTASEKTRLVCQGPLASLMHGSGTWTERDEHDRRVYHGTYMSIVRSCLRPVLGLTARSSNDEAVCLMMGILPPCQALIASRLRHACSIAKWVDMYTACMLVEERRWIDAIREDWLALLAVVALPVGVCPDDGGGKVMEWFLSVHAYKHEIKKAIRNAVAAWSRTTHHQLEAMLKHAAAATAFFKHGGEAGTFTKFAAADIPLPCSECGFQCASHAALASHMRKHGQRSLMSQLGDMTSCQVCACEFWDVARLYMHLRKSPKCKAVFEASDIDLGVGAVARVPAGVKPATRLTGPVDWWATRRPRTPEGSNQSTLKPHVGFYQLWQNIRDSKDSMPTAQFLAKAWQFVHSSLKQSTQVEPVSDHLSDPLLQALCDVCDEGHGYVEGCWMVAVDEHYYIYPSSMPLAIARAFAQP